MTHHALVVSPQAGWAAGSGLAQALSWLSLPTHEVPSLRDAGNAAVAVVVLAPGQAPPAAAQWAHAGLARAIRFTAGARLAMPAGVNGHLDEPIAEGAVARALARAGYTLPLAGERGAIARRIGGLVDGDARLMAELIACLFAGHRADVRAFRQACVQRCWADAAMYAHRIKGTAGMTGTPSLARLSQRIEDLARDGQADAVNGLAALYVPAARRVSDALAALAA